MFAAYNVGLFFAVCIGEGIGLGLFNSPVRHSLDKPMADTSSAQLSYTSLEDGTHKSAGIKHGVNGHTPVAGVSAVEQQVMEMPNGPCCE